MNTNARRPAILVLGIVCSVALSGCGLSNALTRADGNPRLPSLASHFKKKSPNPGSDQVAGNELNSPKKLNDGGLIAAGAEGSPTSENRLARWLFTRTKTNVPQPKRLSLPQTDVRTAKSGADDSFDAF